MQAAHSQQIVPRGTGFPQEPASGLPTRGGRAGSVPSTFGPTLRESAALREKFYVEAEVTSDSRIIQNSQTISLTELCAMLPDDDNFSARARRNDPLALKFLKVRVLNPHILALHAAVAARNSYYTTGVIEMLTHAPDLLTDAPEVTIMETATALSAASAPGKPPAWHALPLTSISCARTAVHAALKAGRVAEAIAIAAIAGPWTFSEIAALHPPPGPPGTQLHAEEYYRNHIAQVGGPGAASGSPDDAGPRGDPRRLERQSQASPSVISGGWESRRLTSTGGEQCGPGSPGGRTASGKSPTPALEIGIQRLIAARYAL
jgi:hypothetical protein